MEVEKLLEFPRYLPAIRNVIAKESKVYLPLITDLKVKCRIIISYKWKKPHGKPIDYKIIIPAHQEGREGKRQKHYKCGIILSTE